MGEDSSVGMEYELQVAVESDHRDVDLASTIWNSSYYKNVAKRTARGDLPSRCLESLQDFLCNNESNVWENSWVRFSEHRLTPWSRKLLARDFVAGKSILHSRQRSDVQRFSCIDKGEAKLRLPISYLLKLSLANIISTGESLSPVLFKTGKSLLDNFVSDNTSPLDHEYNLLANEFNSATERYYRTGLKQQHLREYIWVLIEDCKRMEQKEDLHFKQVMATILQEMLGADFIIKHQESIIQENAEPETIAQVAQGGSGNYQ